MDTDSIASETFEDEFRFLAVGHDEFMELGPAEGHAQAQTSMPSAALVDVVTGSLSLSACVSITTDGPAASGPLSSAYNVQPTFVSRASHASAMNAPSAVASQQGHASSQQVAGPVAVINMGSWLQQDCFDSFPTSPGMGAFTSNNSIISDTTGLPSNIVPFVPGRWPATPWRSASSEGGKQHAPTPARWLATLDEQQCLTPVTTSNAVLTAPGAPLPPRVTRA